MQPDSSAQLIDACSQMDEGIQTEPTIVLDDDIFVSPTIFNGTTEDGDVIARCQATWRQLKAYCQALQQEHANLQALNAQLLERITAPV